jgi:nucleoside-diphosphate kinase
MPIERTLCSTTPDATGQRTRGAMRQRSLDDRREFLALRPARLTRTAAQEPAAGSRSRPCLAGASGFAPSGPHVAAALHAEQVAQSCGAGVAPRGPVSAAQGTRRRPHCRRVTENALHGYDSVGTDRCECGHFFAESERLQ